MSSLVTNSVAVVPDGFYAFTTDESAKCINMIYNPGSFITEDTKRKLSFDISKNKEISGDIFSTIQQYCENQGVGEPWDDDFETQGWFPEPPNYKNIYCGFYILEEIIVARTYGKLYNYKDLLSHLKYFIDQNIGLITNINGNNITDEKIFYIDRVDVHPTKGRGTGLCKPLLTFFLSYLLNKRINLLLVYNASIVLEGLPACLCYLRAGDAVGLELYNYSGTKITSTECEQHIKDGKLYYYVLPGTFVGGAKRKTNRKRKTNNRIKIKTSGKARKGKKSGKARKGKKSGKARKGKKTRKLKYLFV